MAPDAHPAMLEDPLPDEPPAPVDPLAGAVDELLLVPLPLSELELPAPLPVAPGEDMAVVEEASVPGTHEAVPVLDAVDPELALEELVADDSAVAEVPVVERPPQTEVPAVEDPAPCPAAVVEVDVWLADELSESSLVFAGATSVRPAGLRRLGLAVAAAPAVLGRAAGVAATLASTALAISWIPAASLSAAGESGCWWPEEWACVPASR